MKYTYVLAPLLLMSPTVAMAAVCKTIGNVGDILDLECLILSLLSSLLQLFWAVAIAFFIFGIVKFIKNASDETEREKGRKFIVEGLIALVVLVSLWGLVQFVNGTFDIEGGGKPSFIDKNGQIK